MRGLYRGARTRKIKQRERKQWAVSEEAAHVKRIIYLYSLRPNKAACRVRASLIFGSTAWTRFCRESEETYVPYPKRLPQALIRSHVTSTTRSSTQQMTAAGGLANSAIRGIAEAVLNIR